MFCSSCGQRLDKRVSLWRLDKIPYGTRYAYENMSSVFPKAAIRTGSHFPVLFQKGDEDTLRTLMIVSPTFTPEPDEMKAIIQFAATGNQVFISALQIDDTVFAMLHQKQDESLISFTDSSELSILDPEKKTWIKYVYPGYKCDSHFESVDTSYTAVLGKNSEGKANFIRIGYGHGGSVFWALYLTMLLFLIMFLMETKRKQRPVTELPPLRNASEDFIKTVGRLYFQQKNNLNLATKMVASFLENIRSAYKLPTSQLDEEFARKLSFRAGRPFGEVAQLIQFIYDLGLKTALSDQELMDLHQQINQFNKPA